MRVNCTYVIPASALANKHKASSASRNVCLSGSSGSYIMTTEYSLNTAQGRFIQMTIYTDRM